MNERIYLCCFDDCYNTSQLKKVQKLLSSVFYHNIKLTFINLIAEIKWISESTAFV
jgi:hypothetical protein